MTSNHETTDEEARALIRRAVAFRDGDFYMGSIARAALWRIVGARYSDGDFDAALVAAPLAVLDAALDYCAPYIREMERVSARQMRSLPMSDDRPNTPGDQHDHAAIRLSRHQGRRMSGRHSG